MEYEITYLVGENKESEIDSIKKEIESVLKKEKAEILDIEIINQRKLSYEVDHQIRGTYVTKRFELPEKKDSESEETKEDSISAVTRKLNLNSDILQVIYCTKFCQFL